MFDTTTLRLHSMGFQCNSGDDTGGAGTDDAAGTKDGGGNTPTTPVTD